MKHSVFSTAVLISLVISSASSQTQSLYSFLKNTDEVTIALSSELEQIKEAFEKGDSSIVGSVSISTNSGPSFELQTTFELGGKTRRKICRYPPVKFNYKKQELAQYNFIEDCDRAKIVVQCNTTGSMEQSIIMEKTIYDLYQVVSDYGRSAKIVQIADTKKKDLIGFLLEEDEDFEQRTKTEVIKNKTVATTILDRSEYIKMCLFQYMISNADWSARKGHNTDLYRRLTDDALIVVPYDFDYSGIINNNYAVAPENLPINTVTQRYFMDKNVTEGELMTGVAFFIEKEQSIFDVITSSAHLSNGSKKRMTKFIEGFYKTIKDEKKVMKILR